MIFQIARKNIWRNKLRSSVVLFAISIGLVAGILSVGVMNGAILDRVKKAIRNEVASIQLHDPEFLLNGDVKDLIENSDSITSVLINYPDIKAVSAKLKIEAMITSGHGPRGVQVLGVNPTDEKEVSAIYSTINDSSGSWFESIRRNPIVISRRLAEKLHAHLNSKLEIDAITKSGESTSAIFRVIGIYHTDNSMFDEFNVYVNINDLSKILEFKKGESHEISILSTDLMNPDSLEFSLRKSLAKYQIDSSAILTMENADIKPYIINFFRSKISQKIYDYSAFNQLIKVNVNAEDQALAKQIIFDACETQINIMSWKKLAPELQMTTYWMDMLLFLFVGIILLALGFGIINTMLMVVLERVKELGMLMAIGMNRKRVYLMVLEETVMLSLLGGIIGVAISYILISILSVVGIDLSSLSEGLNAMGYSSIIYPYIDLKSYLEVAIMVIFTGIFAALYPAWKAVKLNPAEAVRSE